MSDNEMADVTLGDDKTILPGKNKKIALIDADTIVFAACCALEYEETLLPKELYSTDEWEELISNEGYVEEDNCIYSVNLDEAIVHAQDKIRQILNYTGCETYELYFTTGRKSFRYKIVDDKYKVNRTSSRAPQSIYALKRWFIDNDNGIDSKEWEADDIVVALKRDNPDKYIMCAVDKDLLYAIVGTHCNYYQSRRYNIDMKWITVDDITAMKHPYMQTLTGDTTDGVIGLHGIGPKKAAKLLKDCKTPEECWSVVTREYGKVNRDLDALLNMRLVNMHQVQLVDGEYKVVLWHP